MSMINNNIYRNYCNYFVFGVPISRGKQRNTFFCFFVHLRGQLGQRFHLRTHVVKISYALKMIILKGRISLNYRKISQAIIKPIFREKMFYYRMTVLRYSPELFPILFNIRPFIKNTSEALLLRRGKGFFSFWLF